VLSTGDPSSLAGQLGPTRLDREEQSVWIDGDRPVFAPGAVLTGGFQVHPPTIDDQLRRVELSVLWAAGTPAQQSGLFASTHSRRRLRFQELDVCHFEVFEAKGDDATELYTSRPFRALLPKGPPSFPGPVMLVFWSVRVRLQYAHGHDLTDELPFLVVPRIG
jgi:hypothetical protein